VTQEHLIPWPYFGKSETLRFADQAEGTAIKFENARGIDKRTGRLRGASRPGLTKACTTVAGTGPIKHLTSITYDAKRHQYAAEPLGQEPVEWSAELRSLLGAPDGVHDLQGNFYVIDGRNTVTKFNADGEIVWTLSLPTANEDQLCAAVAVGDDLAVYAAVSGGSDPRKARIWRFANAADDSVPTMDFEIEDVGFVYAMKVFQGQLYTLQNIPRLWRAQLVVYSALDGGEPIESQSSEAAYPAVNLDIGDDGSVYVSSPPFANRGKNPRAPGFTATAIEWTPNDMIDTIPGAPVGSIANYDPDTMLWWWADPSEIFGLTDNDAVKAIEDISGNGRHFVVDGTQRPPRYNSRGVGWRPTVRFNGVDESLRTAPNTYGGAGTHDSQKGIIPAFSGSTSYTLMVLRPALEEPGGNGIPRTVFYMGNVGGAAGERMLTVGRSGATLPGGGAPADRGLIAWYEQFAGPSYPAAGSFDLTPNVVIASVGLNSTVSANFRINGVNVATWTPARAYLADSSTYLGRTPETAAMGFFLGDFLEGLTIYSTNGFFIAGILNYFEGYLAWKHGIAHLLPGGHPYKLTPPLKFGQTLSPSFRLTSTKGIVAKYSSASGSLVWVATSSGTTPLGGVGHGVVWSSKEKAIYTTGPRDSIGSNFDDVVVRKIIDKGEEYSTAYADGAWSEPFPPGIAWTPGSAIPGSMDVQYDRVRLAVDTFGNLYVPWYITPSSTAVSSQLQLIVFARDGQNMTTFRRGKILATLDSSRFPDDQQVYGVSCDPNVPPYIVDSPATSVLTPDFRPSPISVLHYARAQHVVLFTRNQIGVNPVTATVPCVHRARLVSTSVRTGSPRAVARVVVCDNTFKVWDTPSLMIEPAGSGTLPSPQFSPEARFISSTEYVTPDKGNCLFLTDGENYFQYIPRERRLLKYKSRSSGKPPAGCEILTTWRGRLVFVVGENRGTWHMTKFGDPYDNNLYPSVLDGTQAMNSDTAEARKCPDMINTVASINDDHCLFGCDSSIWRMTGDPARGGVFDRISGKVGMSFGRSWTTDTRGRFWFWGSRGGLYLMPSFNSEPERVSLNTIDVDMQSLDLTGYHVELTWNTDPRAEGLHINAFQYGSTEGVPARHWFYEEKTGAQSPDSYGLRGATPTQPSAVMVLDGDKPNDRRVIYGCEDGFIRMVNPNAADDDGVPIEFDVFIWPLQSQRIGGEQRWWDFQADLAFDQGIVNYELYVSDIADAPGEPVERGVLMPGRNLSTPAICAGAYWGVRFKSYAAGNSVAFERLSVRSAPAGRRR
jgi:hypothetical protein